MFGHFLDASRWLCRYQRNNKSGGIKNLRCFPTCHEDGHRVQGFCGTPVTFVLTTLPSSSTGTTKQQRDGNGNSNGIVFVAELTLLENLPRSRISSQEEKECDGEASELLRGERHNELVVFNSKRRGWRYGWVATKYTSDLPHVLRVYLLVRNEDGEFDVVDRVDSRPFTIFCRRRSRAGVDNLPPQFKSPEHLALRDGSAALASKRKSESSPSPTNSITKTKKNVSNNKRTKRLSSSGMPNTDSDTDATVSPLITLARAAVAAAPAAVPEFPWAPSSDRDLGAVLAAIQARVQHEPGAGETTADLDFMDSDNIAMLLSGDDVGILDWLDDAASLPLTRSPSPFAQTTPLGAAPTVVGGGGNLLSSLEFPASSPPPSSSFHGGAPVVVDSPGVPAIVSASHLDAILSRAARFLVEMDDSTLPTEDLYVEVGHRMDRYFWKNEGLTVTDVAEQVRILFQTSLSANNAQATKKFQLLETSFRPDEPICAQFTRGSPNDLTGHWRRTQETSEVNLRIRELTGSSWVERQLMRQMEEEFFVEARSDNTELLFTYPRHTRGADRQRVLRLNALAPLKPGSGPLGTTPAAVEAGIWATERGVYFVSQFTPTLRCIRFTARSQDGTRLDSRVRVQQKRLVVDASSSSSSLQQQQEDNQMSEWVDVCDESACAVKFTANE